MTATFEQAYDEVLTTFKTAWDVPGHPVDYPNVTPTLTVPPAGDSSPWARVTITGLPPSARSLTGLSTARYTRNGLLIVQIFVPLGEGLAEAYNLSKIVADAFEGVHTPRQVWFRNVRVQEIGPDGEWFQTNVLVDFTYDEVK